MKNKKNQKKLFAIVAIAIFGLLTSGFSALAVVNQPPVISGGWTIANFEIGVSAPSFGFNEYQAKDQVIALDSEDGNITSKIEAFGVSSVNVTIPGTYFVMLSITDSGGLTDTLLKEINVRNQGEATPGRCFEAGDLTDIYTIACEPAPIYQCSDSLDNDQDGKVDSTDPGCWTNPQNSQTYDPNDNSEAGEPTYQCSDGIDNDQDGKIDMTDPGCLSPIDNDEYNAPQNQAPSIVLLGANPMSVVKGAVFTDPGATASDTEDGNLTPKIKKIGQVDTSIVGVYTITYSAHDSGQLGATTTRAVNVIENQTQNQAPVITLTGGDMTISFGSVFTDPGYTAQDTEDGNITNKVVVGGSVVNTSNAGPYVITYNVKDSQNLPATQKTRNVMVQEQSHGGGGGGGGGGYISIQSTPGLQITDEKVVYLGNGNAQVTWKTNLVATSQVVYGTTSHSMTNAAWENYGYPLTTVEVKDMVATHTMLVSGLQDGIAYYFRPLSANSSAQQVIGKEVSYTSAVIAPVIVAPIEAPKGECNYLLEYLKIGQNNNPVEVRKMQTFLNSFDNAGLEVSGVFDQATFNAVEKFQMKHLNDVLTPWGYDSPTGYVYITTKKKVNELYCQKPFPLTATQQKEVDDTRAIYLSQPEAVDTGLIGKIQQPQQPENVVVQTAPQIPSVVETQEPIVKQALPESGLVADISGTAKQETEESDLDTEGLAALSIAGMGGVVSGRLIYWLALILTVLVLISVVLYFRSRRKKLLPYSMPPFPNMPSAFPESIPTQ